MVKDKLLIIDQQMQISYREVKGNHIGIVYLNGFMSNKNTPKCQAVEEYCKSQELNFICFDYYGNGNSSGNIYDVTIGKYLESSLQILDKLTSGPQILVASSAGAWIMNLIAQVRTDRIAGMLGIASAPDFTKYLMWDTFSDKIKTEIITNKVWESPEFPVTLQLIEEAKQHYILNKKLDFPFPIILLHGKADTRVPFEYSEKLLHCYNSNAKLISVADADHAFNRSSDIQTIIENVILLRSLAENN